MFSLRQTALCIFCAVAAAAAIQLGAQDVKPIGEYKPVDNPVFKHKYTADPAPVVYARPSGRGSRSSRRSRCRLCGRA